MQNFMYFHLGPTISIERIQRVGKVMAISSIFRPSDRSKQLFEVECFLPKGFCFQFKQCLLAFLLI